MGLNTPRKVLEKRLRGLPGQFLPWSPSGLDRQRSLNVLLQCPQLPLPMFQPRLEGREGIIYYYFLYVLMYYYPLIFILSSIKPLIVLYGQRSLSGCGNVRSRPYQCSSLDARKVGEVLIFFIFKELFKPLLMPKRKERKGARIAYTVDQNVPMLHALLKIDVYECCSKC